MSHLRKQIRDALIATIEAIEGLAHKVVSDPSSIEDAEGETEWVEVAIGAEAVTHRVHGSRAIIRQAQASAVLHTAGGAAAVDRLDELLAAVEQAAFENRALGGLLYSPLALQSIEPATPDRTGSLPLHSLRITWACAYTTTGAGAAVAAST